MRIWITGASGMLAHDLAEAATLAGHTLFTSDREVDITSPEAVKSYLDAHAVDWVINCAAYTAVDKAESEESLAFAINALGPAHLAEATAARQIPFLHVSTDYVLNGQAPDPLSEGAPLAPQSAYGRTKAKGEVRVQVLNPNHWIVRTAWLYGLAGNNFVKTMLRLMAEKDSLRVVDDQWGSPTWSVDLAHALLSIVSQQKAPGLYHYSNEGQITWCTFAREIQRQALALGLLQKEIPLEGIPSSAYPTPVKRPQWSVLDKSLIKATFAVEVPSWQDSLAKYLTLEVKARA